MLLRHPRALTARSANFAQLTDVLRASYCQTATYELSATRAESTPVTYESHKVLNQAPLLVGHNVYLSDKAMVENVALYGASWAEKHLTALGITAGSDAVQQLAHLANKEGPILTTHDRYGNRINTVRFSPHYHELMKNAIEVSRTPSFAWTQDNMNKPGAHVARAVLSAMTYQCEPGTSCPLTMTYACAPVLRDSPNMQEWYAKATNTIYDWQDKPISQKQGVTVGMSMTEKQGGTDVRANTTVAKHVIDDQYALTGHKWFTSAPMCDGFLTLAYVEGSKSLSCFMVPRWTPSGEKNVGFKIQRLKDKLGDKSNASSEVEYHSALAQLVGREGRGIATIMDMVALTRLDCTTGSSALIKQSVNFALNHISGRAAFGKRLVDQPLMMNVAADLAIEADASMYMALRNAYAVDLAEKGDREQLHFMRIAVAISKYFVCKAAPKTVYEAMECFGGNGYDEEWHMARLYRQAPLNSIWEGSGNVICLDVMRAMTKEPDTHHILFKELEKAKGMDARFDTFLGEVRKLTKNLTDQRHMRRVVDTLAIALQGSLLLRHAPTHVAEAFCVSRLGANGMGRHNFGTLDLTHSELQALVDRAMPVPAELEYDSKF